MKSIVVVDDEPVLRGLVVASLAARGYDVRQAKDGEDGVALCHEMTPSLVLCDLSMPRLNGFQTLSRLRADPRTAAVPFILMTGSDDGAGMRRGMELGADDFLLKPFQMDDVVKAVETRLARHHAIEAKAERQLAARGETLGSSLSHELRTPLNAILGYASLLSEEEPLSHVEVVEVARSILLAGERLRRLVERQLAYAEVELMAAGEGRGPALTEEAASIVHEVARAVAARADRAADLSVDVTPARAQVPAPHLASIVTELVENALKFSLPGDPVRVSAAAEQPWFRLRVADGGRGMTPREMGDVAAYVQFGRRKLEQQGLGIGLALARKTAELWGGSLALSPTTPRGVTVTVTLPG